MRWKSNRYDTNFFIEFGKIYCLILFCLFNIVKIPYILFRFQAKILESKQEHLSNTNWVINQNWEKFGQDLESVQTKILKAQAVLSNDLENIQAIGNITDTITITPAGEILDHDSRNK